MSSGLSLNNHPEGENMNVAFDPWIPVMSTSGKRELASLCAVLAEGEKFTDLAVRPHERVALMRLFLCVAHAALEGPKNYDEWLEVPNRLPEAVNTYLKKWGDSFELFHEKNPWLQVAELKEIKKEKREKEGKKEVKKTENDSDEEKGWSTLNRLSFTRACGINSTLFDHESNGGKSTKYTTEEIALNLLTFQNYFVAGGKASSRLWGDVEMRNPPNPKGGPCAGKSILFTFIRAENLFKSIQMNLNTYEDLRLFYGDSADWLGKPIWEMPIKSPTHNAAISNATQTHIGRLVPQTRILRINDDRERVLLGAGFFYPKFQDEKNTFYPDLFATIVLNKNGERELLSARPGISVWRALHSLAVRRKGASESSRGPLCLLNLPDANGLDIIVNAMMTNPKQPAEIVDFLESVFHIPSRLLVPEGTVSYESEVKKAEAWATRLGWAIEDYRTVIDGGWEARVKASKDKRKLLSQLYSNATGHFWTTVEKQLPLLMIHIEAIDTEAAIPTQEAWRKMLFSAVCEAYEVACGQETPRQMRAFAKGLQKLTKRTDKSKSDSPDIKEVNDELAS
jgi:CRISPR system Cascade subunit CasA